MSPKKYMEKLKRERRSWNELLLREPEGTMAYRTAMWKVLSLTERIGEIKAHRQERKDELTGIYPHRADEERTPFIEE